MVLVVEGRVPHDDAHDLHRIQVGTRRQASIDADLDLDRPQGRHRLQGRELVRVLPARRARRRPEPIAEVEARQLADDPVDLERQVAPALLELVVVREAGLEPLHRAAEARVGEPPVRERLRELRLRGEGVDALDPRSRIGVELEGVARDLGRVVATDRPRRGVPRVGEACLAASLALLVEGLEPGARDEDLAAHLQQPRHGPPAPIEGQRQVADGAEVRGDLLPHDAIPTRHSPHKAAVLIHDRGADPVELGLAGPGQHLVLLEAEEALDLLDEVLHLLDGEEALDGEHGHGVLRLLEALSLGQRGAHALGRALGNDELRMRRFELLQLAEEPVVLAVRDLGSTLHVVEAVVPQQLGPQRGSTALGLAGGGHGREGRRAQS